jgi:hypothetical protein
VSDPVDAYLLACLILLAWTLTVSAMVTTIVVIARYALIKARAQDVPEVLAGIANIIRAMPWLGYLGSLAAAWLRMGRSLRPGVGRRGQSGEVEDDEEVGPDGGAG